MRHTTRNLSLLGLGLSVSAVVGWLLFEENRRNKTRISKLALSQTADDDMEAPQIILPMESLTDEDEPVFETDSPLSQDDLTRIRDIGPKFAEALHTIGITTFAQLATLTPEDLAAKLASHVNVRAQRIQDNNWIGQAVQLSQNA